VPRSRNKPQRSQRAQSQADTADQSLTCWVTAGAPASALIPLGVSVVPYRFLGRAGRLTIGRGRVFWRPMNEPRGHDRRMAAGVRVFMAGVSAKEA
jgi:hypothetical protein